MSAHNVNTQHAAGQQGAARRFQALHVPGTPLVLFNAWDAGSARAVADAGAKAIATGSWSVAAANGFADGENLPGAFAMDNLRRIVAAVALPVTIDLESGYGETPAAVGATVAAALDAGAIGCNLEDSFPADGALRAIADQVARLAAARKAADAAGIAMYINPAPTCSSRSRPPRTTWRWSTPPSSAPAPTPMSAPAACSSPASSPIT